MTHTTTKTTTNNTDPQAKLREIIENAEPRFTSIDYRGPRDTRVNIDVGSTTYIFALLADAKWRHVWTSTWGNLSAVYGEGCDASGRPMNAELSDALTALIN